MENISASFFQVNTISNFTGDKLPSKLEVMQHIFYHTRDLKLKDFNTCIKLVVENILSIWNDLGFNTKDKLNCMKSVESLYQNWRKHQKSSKETKGRNFEAKVLFQNGINDLFDVAQANISENLDPLRWDFLLNQRKPGRVGSILELKSSLQSNKHIFKL